MIVGLVYSDPGRGRVAIARVAIWIILRCVYPPLTSKDPAQHEGQCYNCGSNREKDQAGIYRHGPSPSLFAKPASVAVLAGICHRHGGVGHAVGEAPFVVVPREDTAHRAFHHLGLVHVEDG